MYFTVEFSHHVTACLCVIELRHEKRDGAAMMFHVNVK